MDFKEKRIVQKSIKDKLSKLAVAGLSFTEKRALQKEITVDFVKIGEDAKSDALEKLYAELSELESKEIFLIEAGKMDKVEELRKEMDPLKRAINEAEGEEIYDIPDAKGEYADGKKSPTYDKLKNGDFLDLPAAEFVEKLKEAAKELGEEDSLTGRIIDPAMSWKEKREGVAVEGVDTDYLDDFLNGVVLPETETANESVDDIEVELIINESEEALNSGQETFTEKEVDDILSANESVELDPETENQFIEEIKGDYQIDPEMALEGYHNEMSFNPDVATEKAKDVDEKKWKYAKKIVLKALFKKEPSGDNEKDNKIIEEGKAWGFVQDRYQKLVKGEIKARQPATESVDEEIEDDEEYII